MASYRAYFLDEHHRIRDSEDFDESSDAAAMSRAAALLGSRQALSAFELWQERRAVRVLRRPGLREEAP